MASDYFSNINYVIQGKVKNLANSAEDVISSTLGSGISTVSSAISNPLSIIGGNSPISKSGLSTETSTISGNTKDIRVRLKAQDERQARQVYGPNEQNNILNILYETNGLLFPYTPVIDWSQEVEYAVMSLTHANQDFYSYKNTPSVSISVSGKFTVQNQREGEYLLAVLHFLRTVSKMYFGKQSDPNVVNRTPNQGVSGMPPPVLIFSGYGNYMFNELPVIVKNHAYSFSDDVDYIDIETAGGLARLPSIINLSLRLIVQNTPQRLRNDFDLDKFRTGESMRTDKGWI